MSSSPIIADLHLTLEQYGHQQSDLTFFNLVGRLNNVISRGLFSHSMPSGEKAAAFGELYLELAKILTYTFGHSELRPLSSAEVCGTPEYGEENWASVLVELVKMLTPSRDASPNLYTIVFDSSAVIQSAVQPTYNMRIG
jgi:hypothetical protein